jgi:hypothetical protein
LTACRNHESIANSIQMTTRVTTTCIARNYLLRRLSPGHLSCGDHSAIVIAFRTDGQSHRGWIGKTG